MAILILLILAIAAYHFIYDGIILPSIRQNSRNKLYQLRDELRWEMIEGIDNNDIPAFNLVHDSLNVFVNRLPMITLSMQKQFHTDLQNNETLQKTINKRKKTIEDCSNSKIKQIVLDINDILEATYIANAGGWFIYILPIALTASLLEKIEEDAKELSFAPKHEVYRIIPTTVKAAHC